MALAACAPDQEGAATTESNVIAIVPGSAIRSPNARPEAAYLSSRSIENLKKVSALPGVLATLAARVDSLVGTAEPDGRITLDELVALEKPGLLEQLIPAERLVLPDLWRLFEVTKDAPAAVVIPAIDTILATDVSEIATQPLEPATLLVTSLRSELQRTASRLEQVHDSDQDPKTVSKADIDAALASPAVFQPWEVAQLQVIRPIFVERAGTKLAARVRVPVAVALKTYDNPVLATWGAGSLGLQNGVEYVEKRTKSTVTNDITVSITGRVLQRALLTLPSTHQILMLEDGSDRETFVASGVLEGTAGTKTVEVWSNGVRLSSFRAKLPEIKAREVAVDLTKYADYKFVFKAPPAAAAADVDAAEVDAPASDIALVRNTSETSLTENGTKYNATFTYTKDSAWSSIDSAIADQTKTPLFTVAAGRYKLSDDVSVQLYPEGIVTVIRANGWTERAVWRGNQWVLPSGSDFRFSYDPKTNRLDVQSAAGAPIFTGPLTGTLRTG